MRSEVRLLVLGLAILYATVFSFVEASPALLGLNIAQVSSSIAIVLLFIFLYQLSERLTVHERAGVLFGLAITGIIASVLMTYAHYSSASAFCPPLPQGEAVPCDLVNQSLYSEVQGVPVAVLGIIFYLLFAYVSYAQSKMTVGAYPAWVYDAMVLHFLAIGAFVFTIWLNYVQFAILKTLCLFCEVSAATVVGTLLFSYQNWRDA